MPKFSRWINFYFRVDYRSLGLFRWTLGLVLIFDWLATWPQIEAFYSTAGVLPLQAGMPRAGGPYHFSLLNSVESTPMLQAVFLVGLACYVGFLIGYKTRLCHIGSLLFLVSVFNRNGLIRTGADAVLVTMLLWSVFLPLGARFSWDSLRIPKSSEPQLCRPSLAAFAIVAQFATIYFVTAMHKLGPTWLDGTAVYYVLHVDHIATRFGLWMRDCPLWLLKQFTWGTIILEFAVAPLILSPILQPSLRRIAAAGLLSLHLGIAATMSLGMFSWVMLANLPLLLLPADWDAIERIAAKVVPKLTPYLTRLTPKFAAASLSSLINDPANLEVSTPSAGSSPGSQWRNDIALNLLACWLMLAIGVATFNHNFAGKSAKYRLPEPSWIRLVSHTLQLKHDWKLFAPKPLRDDGWWVVDGITQNGDHFDPLTAKPTTWIKPRYISEQYDIRWRKYLYNISKPPLARHRLHLGRYLTRKNRLTQPAENRLVRFDIYFMMELTQPPGTPQPFEVRKIPLWHHECVAPSPGRPGSGIRPTPDTIGETPTLRDETAPHNDADPAALSVP